MTAHIHPELVRIGDELESAVSREIGDRRTSRRRRLWSRAATTVAVVAGAFAIAGTAVAATGLLSAETVASGLPGGAVIFEGTDPTCTTTDDGVFDCTLATAPVTMVKTFVGTKETFVDDNNDIAGGCIGQDVAGMHWICYTGQRAVDEHILVASLLGDHQTGPSGG